MAFSQSLWLPSPCFTCISSYEINIKEKKYVMEGRRRSLGKYIWEMLQTTSCPRDALGVSVSHRPPGGLCEWNPASPRIPITQGGHLTPPIRKAIPSPDSSTPGGTKSLWGLWHSHPKDSEMRGATLIDLEQADSWMTIPENRFFSFSLKQEAHG